MISQSNIEDWFGGIFLAHRDFLQHLFLIIFWEEENEQQLIYFAYRLNYPDIQKSHRWSRMQCIIVDNYNFSTQEKIAF